MNTSVNVCLYEKVVKLKKFRIQLTTCKLEQKLNSLGGTPSFEDHFDIGSQKGDIFHFIILII